MDLTMPSAVLLIHSFVSQEHAALCVCVCVFLSPKKGGIPQLFRRVALTLADFHRNVSNRESQR